ncbi:MAG: MFS transporter [Methanobacterium sp.]|uniref:MFS transporter n=1 Tax=Methanobacterium sp. TaxID=2164 RepID=UPI003D64FDAD|nr:MFS transporter [Methanobacterium sp.]
MKNSNSKWIPLIIVSITLFIALLGSTFLNAAIPQITKDLNTTIRMLQIIIATYSLIVGALMLSAGKIQDFLGKKRILMIGAIIYILGAFISILSFNPSILFIGYSLIAGVGAALMIPATASIIADSYSGKDHEFAIGLWASLAIVGIIIGPLLGGFFTTYFSWKGAFIILILLMAAVIVYSRKLEDDEPILERSDFDWWGSISSTLGLSFLVAGFLMFNNISTWKMSPLLIATGIILLVLFYFKEKNLLKKDEEPLFDINLLSNRTFLVSSILRSFMTLSLYGILFIMPLFMQLVLGLESIVIGVTFIPLAVSAVIFFYISTRISNIFGYKWVLSSSFIIGIIGILILRFQFSLDTQIVDLIPGIFIIGIGIGLCFTEASHLVLSSVNQGKISDASGFMVSINNLGASMGTAVVGIIFILSIFSGLYVAMENEFPDNDTTQLKHEVESWVDNAKSVDIEKIESPDKSKNAIIVNKSIISSIKTAFDFIALILAVGFFLSLFIKPPKSV